jgi:hypothetical protein
MHYFAVFYTPNWPARQLHALHCTVRYLHAQDSLKARSEAALKKLQLTVEDLRNYPFNYNNYYTDTIKKQRKARDMECLAQSIESSTKHTPLAEGGRRSARE